MVFSITPMKLNRILKQYGVAYTFSRPGKNSFGESTGASSSLNIVGVFHPSGERRIAVSGADAASTQTESIPCILTSWQDASNVAVGDSAIINGVPFSVSGIDNVGELNVAGEISLEQKT